MKMCPKLNTPETLILTLFIILLPLKLSAQTINEVWTGLSFDLGLKNNWEAGVRKESRFFMDDYSYNNIFSDLKIGRGITGNLAALGGIRLSRRSNHENNFNLFRYYGYFLWSKKAEYIRFIAKTGVQNDSPLKSFPENNLTSTTMWRNLAEMGFNIPKSRISAILNCEFFNSLNQPDFINFEELRIKPYIKFEISDKHQITSGYMYRYNYLKNAQEGHILTINYTATFSAN